MADEKEKHDQVPADGGTAGAGKSGHPGEGEKPAGVGPVDKAEEIEQQPT